MSNPFLGEIRMFAGSFAPKGWALCNGALLPINQNTALFSLFGIAYGGDGKSTFGLPNLQGNAVIHQGQGASLSPYTLGQTGGVAAVTLNVAQIPSHSHTVYADSQNGLSAAPAAKLFGKAASRTSFLYGVSTSPTLLGDSAVGLTTGGDQPHSNLQPYLVVLFIVALQGIFPPRP